MNRGTLLGTVSDFNNRIKVKLTGKLFVLNPRHGRSNISYRRCALTKINNMARLTKKRYEVDNGRPGPLAGSNNSLFNKYSPHRTVLSRGWSLTVRRRKMSVREITPQNKVQN